MFPLADGAVGSADEIAVSVLAFILLVVVIGIVIRDSRRKRHGDQPTAPDETPEEDSKKVD